MKVGLISFHNADNYGACLQAYALQEAVQNLNISCEYIDYINQSRSDRYKILARIRKSLKDKKIGEAVKLVLGSPFIISRHLKFSRFYQRYLKKTAKIYHSSEEAAELEKQYDKFIIGSDQVWNAEHNGTDSSYFLSFVKDTSKKISYSSSFGMASIPDELLTWYSENLRTIPCLSTREQAGVDLIEKLIDKRAHLVLDPVFLLDRSKWLRLIKTPDHSYRYTFYYINAPFDYEVIEQVTGYRDSHRNILSASVSIRDFFKKDQKVTFSMSPEVFLKQINDAELIVTTSFHCLAFSIIFHKRFIAVLSGNKGKDERLLNILKITGLENRIFSRSMTIEDINADIDYDDVDKRLEVYKNYSKNFLQLGIIEGAEKANELSEPVIKERLPQQYDICDQEKCSGCGACHLRCPKNAIAMKEDEDGFLRPIIDETKCIQCGLCKKVCQHNSQLQSISNQKYYAVKQSPVIRSTSSSGGAFKTMAYSVISNGGVVIAAELDRDWRIKHKVATELDAVNKQGKTYYVQSNAFEQFQNAEYLLNKGLTVLFVGTPCQISGLKKYLNQEYSNLITCDLICHGVPSPKMFNTLIKYLRSKGDLSELNHRDKSIGWKGYTVTAVISGKKYKNTGWLKAYNVMFSHGLINRTSCFQCQYSSYNRPSDITIGDYWGVENHHPRLSDRLGVSLVMVNTEKGKTFFNNAFTRCEIVELEKRETAQNALLRPQNKPKKRLGCLIAMEKSYEHAAKKYGEWNIKGYIKEKIRRTIMVIKGI